MSSACPRPVHPLDPVAAKAADKALYEAHEKDARPNALFDAAGNKLPLSSSDPAQKCLREEWVELYGKKGGKLKKPAPKKNKAPNKAVEPCPCAKANLTVNVHYTPLDAPVNHAKVTITGPVTKTLTTDATGAVKFTDLPPGKYDITAVYDAKDPLVDLAVSHNGGTEWAESVAREAPPVQKFPEGTNKCNLFVFEMLRDAGFSVPLKPHEQKLLGHTLRTVQIPPNAGDWASSSSTVGTSTVVSTPEPGDIVAWSHSFSDATGHVGIVSYPEPSAPTSKNLAPGEDATEDVTMRRKTVSAHAADVGDDSDTFWHFYDEGNAVETGNITFRHMNK